MNIKHVSKMLGAIMLSLCGSALAQDYPVKPVTLVAPFAPGASADGLARLIGKELSAILGQPVVVENKPGGGGAVGLLNVANSAADGYTLGIGATGAIAVSPHLPDSSVLRPKKDLTPVAKLADIPLVFVAGKNAGYPDLKTFIEKAKSTSASPLYAVTGKYTSQHLAAELIGKMAEIKLTSVPYRGSGPAVADVLGGQIDLAMVDLTSAYPHIKAGNLVGLGVTSANRAQAASDIPTIAEAGVPGYAAPAWMGLFVPTGVSPDIINKLARAVHQALEKPSVQKQMITLATEPSYQGPQEFSKFVDSEYTRWGEVIESLSALKN